MLHVVLALDRGFDPFVRFKVDEVVHGVALGEAGDRAGLVLPYAARQVRRDAGIDRAVALGREDVDKAAQGARGARSGVAGSSQAMTTVMYVPDL